MISKGKIIQRGGCGGSNHGCGENLVGGKTGRRKGGAVTWRGGLVKLKEDCKKKKSAGTKKNKLPCSD